MPKKRIDLIMDIIKAQGYVTVKYLCDELHYSTATINRDLNDLQRQKLIVRRYGGAELVVKKGTPLVFRYHEMRPVKRLISERAAELIRDGMTVFIDGSTTAQYIAPYLKEKQNLKVITNNLNLVSHLSEGGIRCICLGGQIIEPPYMTGGVEVAMQAATYTADICFFSTGGISAGGEIYDDNGYFLMHKEMIAHSEKSVFLADHKKIDYRRERILCHISQVDTVITDFTFSEEVRQKSQGTEFITVETPKTQQ